MDAVGWCTKMQLTINSIRDEETILKGEGREYIDKLVNVGEVQEGDL